MRIVTNDQQSFDTEVPRMLNTNFTSATFSVFFIFNDKISAEKIWSEVGALNIIEQNFVIYS